uniref:starch synthase n=1 Tax=Chlamydomonas euryale TaxID=1486919 RepID=A0A7R9VX43_9CHLO|mmetsp:Transcript_5255/g.15872  ORF Transcript_5255/g.15872 Transcript_5255/m.15872 type:complete len:1100 (+) Transcript_5255:198-3497(+)
MRLRLHFPLASRPARCLAALPAGRSWAARHGPVRLGADAGRPRSSIMRASPGEEGTPRVVVVDRDGRKNIDSGAYMDDMMNLSADLDAAGKQGSRRPLSYDEESRAESSRVAARRAVQTHLPDQAVANKHDWMLVTVPDIPVAGEELVIYFNRNCSDALRDKARIFLQYGFNNWELLQDDGTSSVELSPSNIGRDMGSDFYVCKIMVPSETFELNFVLHDGEGTFENNADLDFMYPVEGGITMDKWIDIAAERRAEAAAREAAEAEQREVEAEAAFQAQALENDKALAKQMVEDMRNGGYESLRQYGVKDWKIEADPNRPLWRTLEPEAVCGQKVTLLYNRMQGPMKFFIPEDQALELHFGFNNWQRPGSVRMKRFKKPVEKTESPQPLKTAGVREGVFDKQAEAGVRQKAGSAAEIKDQMPWLFIEGADWWAAEVDVPAEAATMNFSISYYEHVDNALGSNHKLLVELPKGKTFEAWTRSLEPLFFESVYTARKTREEFWKRKEESRRASRAKAQEMVKAVERRKVRHVLYTEPEVVTAGKDLTIFYNPANTILSGRERVFIRGGWNRWNHAKKFGPLEMTKMPNGLCKATVKAPADAFKMDFVFSDVKEGDGTYDSRGGFDYHLPVEGSAVREPGLYVAHVSVEMAPIAKVGGLGDVVIALGRAVKEQGHHVEVILPKYAFFDASPILSGQMRYETDFAWGGTHIYVCTAIVEGIRCFFIEPKNGYFDTGSVYGRNDDEMRFDFFSKAALEFLLRTGRQPDILHCHDWSTAHVAKSYWQDYNAYGLWKAKVVFTIHNMNYGKTKLSQAAYYCQKFTTVSPTYALEVGGNEVVNQHGHKFLGVRNGIDPDLWDPSNNPFLPMPYTSANVTEGKAAARKALRERVGLGGWGNDKLIVGVVSRLTPQKGINLIKHTAFRTTERGGQFVLLGSAPDPKVQSEFDELASKYNGDIARFCFKYDEPLSHLIYAAADIIVVPSMFEPCGLTQMIAMRYGAVPVVRHTGGLKDTVFDVDFDKGRAAWDVWGSTNADVDGAQCTNGFAFEGTDEGALDYALNRAIDAWYNDNGWFRGLQKRVMEQDWSWNRPALDYVELYHSAKKS